MFTGIIETLGTIDSVINSGSNIVLTVSSSISNQLKVDESVAHNGVCLTVTKVEEDSHHVTVIKESLDRSSLGHLTKSSKVNLERAMPANGRLDGHIVQGHVDQTTNCLAIEEVDGSSYFEGRRQIGKRLRYKAKYEENYLDNNKGLIPMTSFFIPD